MECGSESLEDHAMLMDGWMDGGWMMGDGWMMDGWWMDAGWMMDG